MPKTRVICSSCKSLILLMLDLGWAVSSLGAGYAEVGGQWALKFDGVYDYVDLGNESSLQLSGDMSVCAWIRLGHDTSGQCMGIAGKMNANYEGFVLARGEDNKFAFLIGSPEGLCVCTDPGTTDDAEWHHIAGVIEEGRPHLYVDGNLVWDESAPETGLQFIDSGEYAYAGRLLSAVDDWFFDGLVDEIRFYDNGLSAEETAAVMYGYPTSRDTSLVGYWPLEGTNDQVVYDFSGMDNHGRIGNDPLPDYADPYRVPTDYPSGPFAEDRWSDLVTFDSQVEYEAYVTTNNDAYDSGGMLAVERVTIQEPGRLGVLRLENFRDIHSTAPTYGHVKPARAVLTFGDSGGAPSVPSPLPVPITPPPAPIPMPVPIIPRRVIEIQRATVSLAFDYLFLSPEGTLTVTLANGIRQIRLPSVHVPAPDLPGGNDTMTWGRYEETWSSHGFHLDDQPTRITLELTGTAGTVVMIDELIVEVENDVFFLPLPPLLPPYLPSPPPYIPPPYIPPPDIPQIRCNSHCGDIAGFPPYTVGPEDFLAAVYYGNSSEQVPWCLEMGFTQDGVLSPEDMVFFAWIEAYSQICSSGSGPFGAAADPRLDRSQSDALGCTPDAPVLVAGKAYTYDYDEVKDEYKHYFLSDRIFGFDRDCNTVGEPLTWGDDRLNTRLAQDHAGGLYQLNVTEGIVRLSDGQSVLPPGRLPFDGSDVHIGWNGQKGSPPLQDAEFDSFGDVYVVPVLVTSLDGEDYRAAARIRLGTTSDDNSIIQLYNEPLFASGVHEIELDHMQKVYVLDKRHWDDSVLLCYDPDSGLLENGVEDEGRLVPPIIEARPSAFHVSKRDGRILIADEEDKSLLQLSSPHTPFPGTEKVEIPGGMSYITDITEERDSGTIWLVGFHFVSPRPHSGYILVGDTVGDRPIFKPVLAKIPGDGSPGCAVFVSDYEVSGKEYLSLPLSIICTGDQEY